MLIGALLLGSVCVVLAVYALSAHLFPGSLFDTLACTCLCFMAVLILTLTFTGMVSLMFPLPVLLTALLLAVLLVAMRSRLPMLIRESSASQASRLEWILTAGLLLVSALVAIPLLQTVFNESRSLHVDGLVFEIPNVVNFVQLGTLWNFDGLWSYYPYNYGMVLAWGLVFTRDYSLLALMHLLPAVGILLYSILIVNFVLSPQRRLIAGALVVLATLSLQDRNTTLFWVGKADLFLGMCILAAIYYSLRYWYDTARPVIYLALTGLALGMGLGAKLSAIHYVLLLTVILILIHRNMRLRAVIRPTLTLAAGILIFTAPWVIRTFSRYQFDEWDRTFFQWGWESTIANLYHTPVAVSATVSALPWVLAACVGMLLVVWPTAPIKRGIGIVIVAFVLYQTLMTERYFSLDLGVLCLVLVLLAMLLVGRLTIPRIVTQRLSYLSMLTLFGFLALIITPFGAATHGDHSPVVISYRYNPAGFSLLLIALVALGVRAISFPASRLVAVSDSHYRHWVGVGTVVLLVTIAPLVRYLTYHSLDTLPLRYAEYPEITQVYRWARQHLKETSIYVFNLPAYTFYGDELSNRVYQYPYDFNALRFTERWNLADAEQFIAQNHIQFVAIGYLAFATRLPAHVHSEIDRMRALYPVVFEDDQSLIFATGSRLALSEELDDNRNGH